ncbi:Bactoprenol glucosyl transferase [Vibrio nigripulchritudo POn4]|uniref:Bactoprenol glucosyl transferase n=2 Tax=Vibrio nigripulchritudo TaxID=28173 RepID=A0AAV2VMN3_9VIBR|nr:glycosyltransferase family 2 protein [Vibrio nigripulchritudo]CCN63536.1 Bactoprenol glucosyl transferase [Vibrio nigripulchritudo POn4]CCN71229.1 Bactoprenol glucosyl transferase [Vibrio nigripulchritudo SFn118]CCO45955.1 Bactoprenol glucosyl transferase [Vibrio nigripulchritudo SOn1]
MKMVMKISLVVPVLNEQEAIPVFYKTVKENKELSKYKIEILFINDGSTDLTESIIDAIALSDNDVLALNFTRNFGKEPALMAGLEYATGDAVVPIDVDLQDPIEVIPEMIDKWLNGADVVLGKRVDRAADSILKRNTAEWFYKVHNKISDLQIQENVGDFRLLSRDIVEHIKQLPERNLFMKGILSWVGGNVEVVEYTRQERSAGDTKFNGWKLWNFAIEGITSFSTLPLRVWSYIGFVISLLSLFYGGWIILDKFINENPVPGFPTLIVAIVFLGGIQLIGIGIVGEYVGRVYIESKQRPRYLLKQQKYPQATDNNAPVNVESVNFSSSDSKSNSFYKKAK